MAQQQQQQQQQPQQQLQMNDYGAAHQWDRVQLVGFLFCQPHSVLARTELLPRFRYFHERSGDTTNFFWAGYDKQESVVYPDQIPVPEAERFFSAKAFNAARQELEEKTTWTYSGETDLVLSLVIKNPETESFENDYDHALVLVLERMLETKSITSVGRCFEDLFRFGQRQQAQGQNASLSLYSDIQLIRNMKRGLWYWALERLGMAHHFKQCEPFAIRNISKSPQNQ